MSGTAEVPSFRTRYFEALGLTEPRIERSPVRSPESRPLSEETRAALVQALTIAHEIRKFEIELYWKRANYFWAFQAIAFTALGFAYKDGVPNAHLVLVSSALGSFAGLVGYLSARGSKFWQENWESHVDILEEAGASPRMTQTVIARLPISFSVSRVNQNFLLSLAISWLLLVIYKACPWAQTVANELPPYWQASILVAILFVGGGLFAWWHTTDLNGECCDTQNREWRPMQRLWAWPRLRERRPRTTWLVWRHNVACVDTIF